MLPSYLWDFHCYCISVALVSIHWLHDLPGFMHCLCSFFHALVQIFHLPGCVLSYKQRWFSFFLVWVHKYLIFSTSRRPLSTLATANACCWSKQTESVPSWSCFVASTVHSLSQKHPNSLHLFLVQTLPVSTKINRTFDIYHHWSYPHRPFPSKVIWKQIPDFILFWQAFINVLACLSRR